MATQHKHKFSAIILAAGKGTRMRSRMPKVLHKLAGMPLIGHVVAAVQSLSPEHIVTVVAPGMEAVQAAAQGAHFAVQHEQMGTGHAVKCAVEQKLSAYTGTVLILCGDTPLITPATLERLISASTSTDVVVVGMRVENPTGYGRMVTDGDTLKAIVECRDATAEQKQITLCNSGVLAISGAHLAGLLSGLKNNNAAGEYYLTDVVAVANEKGLRCTVIEADSAELAGINSRVQLAQVESVFQSRMRIRAMEQGATLVDPASVFFSADTYLGQDVVVHPNVVFGPKVHVGDNVEIKAFSHIEGTRIENGATIGPFARLRPGTHVGEAAHVGNFVELKNTQLKKGAKANHLSYVGDSEVGEGANIGAGTITCNYDGVNKFKTTIGKDAFIGSNSSLVAPISIGEGAIVGAGSVITHDVPNGALAVARGQQSNVDGKAIEIKLRKK